MASRYWVGTSNPGWNNVAGSKWSATSGGASGASAPGVNDDVFIDAASSAGDPPFCIVTLTDNVEIKSLTLTGFTGQLVIGGTPFTLTINGAGLTVPGTMSFINSGIIKFTRTTGTNTISGMHGKCIIDGVGGTFNIINDAGLGILHVLGGTVTVNTDLSSIRSILSTGTNVRSLSLGTSVLTFINGNDSGVPIVFSGSSFTFDAGTSQMTFVSTTNGPRVIAGGGKTFYDVILNEDYTVSDSNAFHSLLVAAAKTITFTAGTTQTVSGTFTAEGSAGNVITLNSSASGAVATISAAVSVLNYLSVRDMTVTGAATWTTDNSDDVDNNTGWIFIGQNKGAFFEFFGSS